MESAPGNPSASGAGADARPAPEAAPAGRLASADLCPSLPQENPTSEPTGRMDPQTSKDAPSTASQAGAARDARPDNPLQNVVRLNPRPEIRRPERTRNARLTIVRPRSPLRPASCRSPASNRSARPTAAGRRTRRRPRPGPPSARKIRRNALKPWNPRPETTGAAGWPSSPPSRPPPSLPGRLWTPKPSGGARWRDGAIRRPGRARRRGGRRSGRGVKDQPLSGSRL